MHAYGKAKHSSYSMNGVGNTGLLSRSLPLFFFVYTRSHISYISWYIFWLRLQYTHKYHTTPHRLINHIVCVHCVQALKAIFLFGSKWLPRTFSCLYLCLSIQAVRVVERIVVAVAKKRERYSTTSKFGGRAVRRELSFSEVVSRTFG